MFVISLVVLLALLPITHSFVVTPTRNQLNVCRINVSLNDTMKGSVYIAATLDGFVATKSGDVSFLDSYHENGPSPDEEFGFNTFLASVDVIIMGRKSFEKVLSFGKDMWAYGKKHVVVWTRKGLPIPEHLQDTVSCSSQTPEELFLTLAQKGYGRAYVDGGFTVQSFLRSKLIDEMIITRVPLLLGKGISLFGPLEESMVLVHKETKAYPNGLITSRYQV